MSAESSLSSRQTRRAGSPATPSTSTAARSSGADDRRVRTDYDDPDSDAQHPPRRHGAVRQAGPRSNRDGRCVLSPSFTNPERRRPMKLYHSSGSPNSRRVRILIAEKGLDIELVPVDLGKKEQFSDAYRAINPRLVVPTLVLDDGTVIGEVPAIMRYLDEAYPKLTLLGTTPKEKALIAMWERRAELEGFASVMEGVRNAAAGLKGRAISGPHGYEQIPALIERSKERVANFYTDFEARLKDVEFVAGDRFSAADITTLVTVDFATQAFAMPIPDDSVALKRWYDAISARPSATA